MRQKTILQLVPLHQETDYLEHFQTLSAVNVEIREKGATAERLLRKAILEVDVGNFSAGLEAARDAADLRPEWAEAHFQQGTALMLLAFTRVGILAGSSGMAPPAAGAKTLMEHAARAFGQALRLNPADEEVAEDVAALSGFLTEHDEGLDDALRELAISD